jgi:hypothetical protein
MHRDILKPNEGMDIDHKDHKGMNCQRNNLRICINKENSRNSTSRKGSKSKYLGVYFNKTKGYVYIRSNIGVNGTQLNLGQFKTEEAAARTYNDAAARLYFGEFVNLNFK